jgi:hypothetical protein
LVQELDDGEKASQLIAESRQKRTTTTSLRPRFLANLAVNNLKPAVPEEETIDIFADIDAWDDYSSLFTLPKSPADVVDPVCEGVARDEKALAGGFEVHKVWERAVRSAVMGLWIPPPPPEEGFQSAISGVSDVDVHMVDVASS